MANTIISTNMNLPIPVVGEDPGPDWANNINACLSDIDSHNHTTGQGVPITPAAIDINTDLAMNGNNLISTRSVRFASQASPINLAADLGCLYESGVDLYYNDGSGNQIRLTQSGSPAGATGTITGLPSGTASASFSGSTFTFQSATNTPATMNIGPIILGQPVASGFNITISPSVSQASNYALTMPLALPSAPSYVTSDASGNLSFLYNGANVRASEGAGTTTLTSADNFWQVFNLSAARTVLLPSGSITKGQRFVMENVGTFPLTVQSSGANTLCVVDSLYSRAEFVALVDSPSTAANWTVRIDYSRTTYSHGTTYNGGIAPTVALAGGTAGTLSSVRQANFVPYQMIDGSWWMDLVVAVSLSSNARSFATLSVNGVTFYDAGSGDGQPLSGSNEAASPVLEITADRNIGTITQTYSTGFVTVAAYFGGTVRLASKPTWAY